MSLLRSYVRATNSLRATLRRCFLETIPLPFCVLCAFLRLLLSVFVPFVVFPYCNFYFLGAGRVRGHARHAIIADPRSYRTDSDRLASLLSAASRVRRECTGYPSTVSLRAAAFP